MSGINDLQIRWYNVEGYTENEKLKHRSKISQDEITTSNGLNKDETFLRIIHRVFPSGFKSQLKEIKAMSSGQSSHMKEEKEIPHETNVPVIESLNFSPSMKYTFRKVLENLNEFSKLTTEDTTSFSSLDFNCPNLSLINRNSAIVSDIEDEYFNLTMKTPLRSSHLSRILKKNLPDMAEIISAEAFLSFFVKEYHLNTPLSSELELNYKSMYENVIKKDKIVYKMLKKRQNMLPKDMITLIKNETKSKKNTEINTLKDAISDKDLSFFTSLSSYFNTIMEEVANDIIELSNFYYPLFYVTFDFVKPIQSIVECDDEEILKKEIIQLNKEIKICKKEPGSLIHFKIMNLICSGELNNTFAVILSNLCGNWLNNILKCLFSTFSSIREQSCLVLAYVITRPVLMEELLQNKQYDVVYDMFVVLLRAIEIFPENLSSFYCVIGYIFQNACSVEIIDYIIETGPNLTNAFLKEKWPRLLYYSMKYWPMSFLSKSPGLLRKIMDTLQQMILQKKAKKMSKLALYFLCRKFTMYPILVTVWYNTNIGKKLKR